MENKLIQTEPSHVAILVPSARKAADFLRQFDFQIGSEERWENEGTLEIYIEREKGNSLLLMEPIRAGAYQRALEKRGPGLHHLAINVLNIEAYIESLAGTGWLLHPSSLKMIRQSQTAYLARPGFPGLIEVQQCKEIKDRALFVDGLTISMEPNLKGLIKPLGLENILKIGPEGELSLGQKTIQLKDLLR